MVSEGVSKELTQELYKGGYIQTIYNTKSERHQREGWTLKNWLWSPWFLNLRPLGDSPYLVNRISFHMNQMIRESVQGLTKIVGVEMAGVPLAATIGTKVGHSEGVRDGYISSIPIPYAYTRPLPGGAKPRTPEEAAEILSKLKSHKEYGQKELVEGTLREGDVICIVDDMVTDFGSKLIARYIIEHELARRGIARESVRIDDVAVVLDREQGGNEEARKNGMNMYSLIKFKTQGIGWLEGAMHPQEFALVSSYQNNPQLYQNPGMQKEALDRANFLRG